MDNVVIGMDPHKRSMTIEVLDPQERVLAKHRFATDADGFASMMRCAHRWPWPSAMITDVPDVRPPSSRPDRWRPSLYS